MIKIGKNFKCFTQVAIGRSCKIGDGVQIGNEDLSPVKIGNNVIIQDRVIIEGGVTIGNDAIIMAGSLVNKDIEPGVGVAGWPAQTVGR